jgi:hypothetical protein
MKKIITCTLIALFIATATTNTGCVKSSSTNNPITAIPDLSDFLFDAATFVLGQASKITIHSTSMGSGTFTVNYSLTGAVNLLNQTATLIMSGGDGDFMTPTISDAGNVTIKINSISNSSGGSASVTSGNTKVFTDSTGVMTCKLNGTSYRAIDVHTSLAGSLLTISSTFWDPLTTVNLHVAYWSHTTGSTYFNSNNLEFNGNNNSTFNGSAVYNGGSIYPSANGVITITSTSPRLTGTFSFKANDSSMISNGTFDAPAP